ncbi:MAG: type I methionyl aminopeptidase [Candidatus Aminicenantes bacterium]|nr:type I methionyl aminopeptidase [Acidobacteriota bacterium]MCG2810618.1 type I methionyl aminopeptidase [Candidatus Aminicenantes bacterium]
MIMLKTDRELTLMRAANRIVALVLDDLGEMIKPGVTTLELDTWAEQRILGLKGKPGFKGYGARSGANPFPATLCTSINQEVVHGIPSAQRILQEGDIIGVDVGVIYEGYYGDGAYTYPVGSISSNARDLLDTCQNALHLGIEQARSGNHLGDIAKAIDGCVRARGFEVVRDLSGHGIGRSLHEDPQILNYYDGQSGAKLKSRMTLAIEPMINAGSYEVHTLDDDWTVVTCDGSLSAHYEHTVALTDNGAEILTRC